ncbi:MAG: class I SAM-dependent methyltransferase [Methylococcales bacterium]|nr:class I SAM-dependent methyltransferase [Methylococcales bacterium]
MWSPEREDRLRHVQLAERLQLPLNTEAEFPEDAWVLNFKTDGLYLQDHARGGVTVNIQPRPGEPRRIPGPKTGPLAQAIGRQSQTMIDATGGFGQDALALWRMGLTVTIIERQPLLFALLEDAVARLSQAYPHMPSPTLLFGDAMVLLPSLPPVDCVYLDPMFPPKRKSSALAKKPMQLLDTLLDGDPDKLELLAVALRCSAKRVVVKSPTWAKPLAGKPDLSLASKLLRFDVYLAKGENYV